MHVRRRLVVSVAFCPLRRSRHLFGCNYSALCYACSRFPAIVSRRGAAIRFYRVRALLCCRAVARTLRSRPYTYLKNNNNTFYYAADANVLAAVRTVVILTERFRTSEHKANVRGDAPHAITTIERTLCRMFFRKNQRANTIRWRFVKYDILYGEFHGLESVFGR